MSLIQIDFKRRCLIEVSTEITEVEIRPTDMFDEFDRHIQSIVNRFGDNLPKHAPIYKQSFRSNIFDAYGHGCTHASIHQYRPSAGSESERLWLRPYPFPADLRAIDKFLKKKSGKVLVLGSKSDPFMWLDMKYRLTKFTLELANKYGVQLVIKTISDLCAHDEYIGLLKAGKHSIVMQMGFKEPELRTDEIERCVSPGAPSLKRRQLALEKLRAHGVEITTTYTSLESLTSDHRKHFERRTGSTVQYWIDKSTGSKQAKRME